MPPPGPDERPGQGTGRGSQSPLYQVLDLKEHDMTNIRNLMKQAEEMQERMRRELADLVVEASVGGGMVSVKMSGHKQVVGVDIDPEILDPDDPALVEDLVLAAVNEAGRKVDESLQERLGALAGGIPGMPDFLR